jgi:hydroxyethylthiazole kinase-like uncharacterized protein yjeF
MGMHAQQDNPHYLQVNMLQAMLVPREINSHKGDSGSVAIIGGDDGMVGAALLAARAALFSGAGRVYAAMLSQAAPSVDMLHPEIMLRKPAALAHLNQLDALAIGPGLGQSIAAIELLIFWLKQPSAKQLPVVLDADALNLIAQHQHLADLVKVRQAPMVMTPHAAEAARLLATTADAVQSQRVESALTLAKTFNVTCVLKGAGTVCASADGHYVINTTGNPALASGGTGDVLTGLIAGLIAQGLSVMDAAKLAVYSHGLAADNLVAKHIGPRGLTASELMIEIRSVLNQFALP